MTQRTAPLSKLERFERQLEISRTLSSTLDLPPLLQTIVDVACELTDSEAASILLYDASRDELRFEAVPGEQREDLMDLTVPLEGSVAGWIYSNNEPLVIQNAAKDPRVYRQVDAKLQFQTTSILGVPLRVKDKPIGVIEAVNKLDQGHYTEDDLSVLQTLAAQASIAIENARLLRKLQDANADLTRLDRMKSDFIAIASHELRTPLGLILGHATFLKDLIPEDYSEQMDTIIRSAMKLKELIEDLSTIAHKEQGEARVRWTAVSMCEVVEAVVNRFEGEAARKNIELGFDVPEEDLFVEGDREKIDLALSNLVRNALVFTNDGGQVGVKCESAGGYVKVLVVDNGIGIPADEIERIFERFYQVESHLTRRHGGMGLGLSIAKAMVELHHGQIWCESKEEVGSLFCFMLPETRERANAAAKVFKAS